MLGMAPKPQPEKRSGWVVALLAVPLLLAGYVLSFGPAALLVNEGQLSFQAWGNAYRPIIAASNRSPIVHRTIEWYVGLWGQSYRARLAIDRWHQRKKE